jgi:AcrR family transcriptional regulator
MQPARRSNEERREQSVQHVLAAALQLFVSQGYENATIDAIAAKAGLTKGAVYFYFKGKVALLHALLDDAEALYAGIFEQMRTSREGPVEQLSMFVDWCAETGAKNQELLVLPILVSLQAMGKEPAVAEHVRKMYDRYHEEMNRIATEGQALGLFDDKVAIRERAAVLVALTDGMLLEWYRFADTLDGRALAESAKAQILHGLGVAS